MDFALNPFVTSATPYLTALLAGLFGGVHCVGMCGGIAAAVGMGSTRSERRPLAGMSYVFAYNMGRILTYSVAGAIVGWSGSVAGDLLETYQAWVFLRVLAALLMVAMGLYLGGWWFGLTRIERAGGALWRHLSPLSKRLLPVARPGQALALGLLWGWLPCGLVYSLLIWSLASGGWREGALFMLSFGLGTLPTLMTIGLVAKSFSSFLQRAAARRLAGLTVIVLGLLTLTATLIHRPNVGLGCAVPSVG